MSDAVNQGEGSDRLRQAEAGRIVYVMPEQGIQAPVDEGITLGELWSILWRRKWVIVGMTVIFAVGSVVYALLATEWFRAEALLAPADPKSTSPISGQISGLAALAGVTVGGEGSAEPLAVLQSREFLGGFIEEQGILPVLFKERWDAERGEWRLAGDEEPPDVRDAVRHFRQDVLTVKEDRDTRLVTIAVEWTDPQLAAEWVSLLVSRLNDRLRERALSEAERNVEYLQAELAQTTVVTLQQSIGRLLENELQKLMLARGNDEFAFKILDPAEPPKYRSRPNRALTAVFGTILGGILGILLALGLHAMSSIRAGRGGSPSASA